MQSFLTAFSSLYIIFKIKISIYLNISNLLTTFATKFLAHLTMNIIKTTTIIILNTGIWLIMFVISLPIASFYWLCKVFKRVFVNAK